MESVESGRIPSFQQSDEEVVLRCQCRFKAECGLWSDNVARFLPDNFWPQVDSGPNWVAMMQKLVFFGYWRVVCWRVFTNTSPALLAVSESALPVRSMTLCSKFHRDLKWITAVRRRPDDMSTSPCLTLCSPRVFRGPHDAEVHVQARKPRKFGGVLGLKLSIKTRRTGAMANFWASPEWDCLIGSFCRHGTPAPLCG